MSRVEGSGLPTIHDCQDCGACCLHMGYPSFQYDHPSQADEVHWTNLPQSLKADLLNYIATYPVPAPGELDGVCVWYDAETRQCKHHEHRPQVCRDFQIGGSDCRGWRKHFGIEKNR